VGAPRTTASVDGSLATLFEGLVELGEGLAFNRHLGVEVAEIAPGRCETVLPADERLHNHLGGSTRSPSSRRWSWLAPWLPPRG
jgi:hypothetical protein